MHRDRRIIMHWPAILHPDAMRMAYVIYRRRKKLDYKPEREGILLTS